MALADRALLRVSGPDAVAFLNALVSNDVARAVPGASGPGQAVYAALLTAQGRFLHDFLIASDGEALLLDVAAGRRADLKRRLTLYKLRSKVDIAELDWQGFALFGDAGAPHIPEGGLPFADPRLPALGWRLWLPAGAPPPQALSDPAAYEAHRLHLGVPDGARDIEIEKGLLLENHFEALNGVDFKKGCYIGQELTARTKYRGLVKKQVHRVLADVALPPPGTPVGLDGQEAGVMLSGLGAEGLALLRLDAVAKAQAEGKKLEAAGIALTPQRPDYAGPAPAPKDG
ncbi:YgfZ/GcvT domain-containing protein [Ferrovibrio sp.]|uniref:CAF17-like 4Fe-4S cluster assembly/insertion protein YgfZ n=1 Tax=Ferrovibrio sp. TaxID=1917215 RepID=UPI0039C8AE9B